ncbi:MAG: hypothetical protein EOP52_06385 [Sphingobacteriales bacterium]|nr:MAG: hypothetical protein EOP52_06385 [Sphingobacteriales bacterium]
MIHWLKYLLQTVCCMGILGMSVQRSCAQITTASLLVNRIPEADTIKYDCASGMVQIQVAPPISSATYTVVSTMPAIMIPPSNTTGSFMLRGARSAVLGIDAQGCFTDTTIAFDCGGPALPVSVVQFGATLYQNSKGLIEWVAKDERDLDRYVIEESSDGKAFRDLATIPALPGNTPETQYKYVDTSLWRGYNFYRLALYHLDGHITYSPIRTVFYDFREHINVAFYPNPTTGKITAELVTEIADDFVLVIYDQQSKLMRNPQQFQLTAGRNLIPLDITDLADGNYLFVYKLPVHQVSGTMRITKASY